MTRFIQLSDLHIRGRKKLENINCEKIVRFIIDKLVAILTDPTIVLGKRIVVYFHHHPFYHAVGLEMDDARQVLRILANKAHFVCFGHKHKSKVWSAENNIDWILASGKTTEHNDNHQFQFREVRIDPGSNAVSMITFSPQDG